MAERILRKELLLRYPSICESLPPIEHLPISEYYHDNKIRESGMTNAHYVERAQEFNACVNAQMDKAKIYRAAGPCLFFLGFILFGVGGFLSTDKGSFQAAFIIPGILLCLFGMATMGLGGRMSAVSFFFFFFFFFFFHSIIFTPPLFTTMSNYPTMLCSLIFLLSSVDPYSPIPFLYASPPRSKYSVSCRPRSKTLTESTWLADLSGV